ncbi:hypothetical protein [Desulfobacter hydrogenophilus]|nr:hypothetical protein [Desulfobacter hydrogenophilus]
MPVDKDVAALAEDTLLAERKNMLFNGTALTHGLGKGVVVATGMSTQLGHIFRLAEGAQEEVLTPLGEWTHCGSPGNCDDCRKYMDNKTVVRQRGKKITCISFYDQMMLRIYERGIIERFDIRANLSMPVLPGWSKTCNRLTGIALPNGETQHNKGDKI